MDESSFSFTSDDGTEIQAYRWSPAGDPRAIVQLAHGMGEHAARYRRFAGTLTDAGYVVYANDHRGHGRTAGSADRHGDLGAGGWGALVDDLATLGTLAREEHGVPLVVFGHSMGSFALQQYLLHHSADLDAAILSGSTAFDVIAAAIDPTAEIDLSAFNAPFEPARTEYDWLSRDPDEVDLYVADPACGFGLNAAGAAGMLEGLRDAGSQEHLSQIRSDLPILIVSGDAAPLAGGGPLVELLGDRYREAGVRDVTVQLYVGARHELLNETNRDEVTADIVRWLDRVTAAA